MKLLLLALIWSTHAHARPHDYLKIKKALAHVESMGDVAARNPRTSASGKYQFMSVWDGFFLENAGRTWTSTVPKKTAPPSLKVEASIEQDRLFDVYFDRHVWPWVRKQNTSFSQAELIAIVHRQGLGGAKRFLKTGKDPFSKRYGNTHLQTYLKRYRWALSNG